MTTFEWVSLIVVIVGGFWALTQKLGKIEQALVGKVSYKDCSEKRDNCPCVREFNRKLQKLGESK